MNAKAVVPAFLVFLLGLFVGGLAGGEAMQRLLRAEAIQAGAAEWTITKDGQPQFKWKGCK